MSMYDSPQQWSPPSYSRGMSLKLPAHCGCVTVNIVHCTTQCSHHLDELPDIHDNNGTKLERIIKYTLSVEYT